MSKKNKKKKKVTQKALVTSAFFFSDSLMASFNKCEKHKLELFYRFKQLFIGFTQIIIQQHNMLKSSLAKLRANCPNSTSKLLRFLFTLLLHCVALARLTLKW